jgi:hypothetical protein
MTKAVAAKDFEVDLYAVGTPAECEMHLATRGPHRAKQRPHAGGRGRSGDRARTHGR